MTRPSERAMAEHKAATDPDYLARRRTDPTGGPGHPFAHGEITISLGWGGEYTVSLAVNDEGVPHHLTAYDLDQLDKHFTAIRGIVYRAQWRAAQPPEQDDDAEATD